MGRPQLIMKKADMTPARPMIEPTDRSMPPVRMVKDTPIAAIARIAVSRVMILRFSMPRERGFTMPPNTINKMMTRNRMNSGWPKRALRRSPNVLDWAPPAPV